MSGAPPPAPAPVPSPPPASPSPVPAPASPALAPASPAPASPTRGVAPRRERAVWRRAAEERTAGMLHTSPAFLFAMLTHALVLLVLSLISVAVYVERHHAPVKVRLAATSEVSVAADAIEGALDREPPPDPDLRQLTPEADTGDALQEALGSVAGHEVHLDARAVGVGGGRGGFGRGGAQSGRGGPSQASEGAVKQALEWLRKHRAPDGGWGPLPADHERSGRLPAHSDPARTGMALLCFLSAGHSPAEPGPYQSVCADARAWLIRSTSESGVIGPGAEPRWAMAYHQGMATLGLAEVLQREATPEGLAALRRAVDLLVAWQGRYGWRYTPRGDTDTSVTSWVILALKSAEQVGVTAPPACWKRIREYLESASLEDGRTRYTLQQPPEMPGMHPTGLFLRVMLGESPHTPRNLAAAKLVVEQGQLDGEELFIYYQLYYASLALYQVGGEVWREFNPRNRDAVVGAQVQEGCEDGSWQPARTAWPGTPHAWSPREPYDYDRVIHTCFAALILETYYRYVSSGQETPPAPEARPASDEADLRLRLAEEALRRLRQSPDPATQLAAEAALEEALRALDGPDRARFSAPLLAGLVEVDALAGRSESLLARARAYADALPAGQAPDPRVLRLRRVHAREWALGLAREAAAAAARPEARPEAQPGAQPAARAAAIAAIDSAAGLIEGELGRLEGEERSEAEALLEGLREVGFTLDDVDQAIARSAERFAPSWATGPVTSEERRWVEALLRRAAQGFQAAGRGRGDPEPFARAEEDLRAAEARRLEPRLRAEAQRSDSEGSGETLARLARLRTAAAAQRAAALVALCRWEPALEAARALGDARQASGAEPTEGAAPCAELARRLERQALEGLSRAGTLPAHEQQRLVELLGALPERESSPAGDLVTGLRLLEHGAWGEAAGLLRRAVGSGGLDAEQQLAGWLGLSRIARAQRDLPGAEAALRALPAAAGERLDVRRERALVQRAAGRHQEALAEYQAILRALEEERPPVWWETAEDTALTFEEAGDVPAARAFLSGLLRRDPGLRGAGPRRERLLRLVQRLDSVR